MAKSKETFNKKDKEKKRLKKKQEKKQRMEERKASKRDGNSLEGMLGYVDENGNLSDTPPDPSRRKVFKKEEIQIAVPKSEHQDDNTVRTGKVIFYNRAKGFGFINDDATNERIFFHIKELLEEVEENDPVTYLIESGIRGLNAARLSKIK